MRHIDNVTVLRNNEECINAAIELINQASRFLLIRSYLLDPDLFDNAKINEALSTFARKSRYSEIHILLDAPDRLLQFSHSTLPLIRRLSQKIIVKQYYDEPNEELETTMISDNRGILIKPQQEGKESYFSATDAIYSKEYSEKFEYDWQQSDIAHHLRSFIL